MSTFYASTAHAHYTRARVTVALLRVLASVTVYSAVNLLAVCDKVQVNIDVDQELETLLASLSLLQNNVCSLYVLCVSQVSGTEARCISAKNNIQVLSP